MMPVRCEGGVNYLMRQNGAVRANAKTGTDQPSERGLARTGGAWSREGKDEGGGVGDVDTLCACNRCRGAEFRAMEPSAIFSVIKAFSSNLHEQV